MARPSREDIESRILVESAIDLARRCDISTLLVHADDFPDSARLDGLRRDERVVWITSADEGIGLARRGDRVVRIPAVEFSRLSRIKVGLFVALMNDDVGLDESVICLAGMYGSRRLDTLVIANPRRDFPWFRRRGVERTARIVPRALLERVLHIALRFAAEGREGKAIGTIFVIGDPEELKPFTRQLVLNPCKGHPTRRRQIQSPELLETLREFSALDGAMVVSRRGVVMSAGTYLEAPAPSLRLRSGLGARHQAAAAVTRAARAVSIVISESTGTVTVFCEGATVLELEREAGATRPPAPRQPGRSPG